MKLPALLLFTALAALACADVTDDLFEQLKTEVKAEAKVAREKEGDAGQQRVYQMQETLMRLQRRGGEEDGENLVQTVEAIGAIATSDKLEEICKALARELRTKQDQREKDLTAELEKTLGDALRATIAGKTAKDLDAPLVAVGKLSRESEVRNTRNAKLRTLAGEAQQLWEFIRQWQDYLADVGSGNTDAARQKLQNLVESGHDFSGFMPRSELLGRLAEIKKSAFAGKEKKSSSVEDTDQQVRAILLKATSLDDIPRAIAELEALAAANRSAGMNLGSYPNSLTTLRSLLRIHEELKKGLAANISLASLTNTSNVDGGESLLALRNQLVLLSLPRVLSLPPDAAARPDENIATFLQRVLAGAREKQDWVLANRVLDAAQTLSITVVASTTDRTALQSFLAGSNQERARQYSLAVSSYQAALKTGSQLVTAELVGEHLEAIRKDHPQEFEQGIQLALNPPAPADSRSGRPISYPPNWPWPPGSSPIGAAAATPEKPAVLSVPAAPAKPDAPSEPAKPRPQ